MTANAASAALQDIQPERSLDADGVGSYGLSSVGELLGQVASEVGDTEEDPLVFLNGKRVSDLGDVLDYPAEAVQRLDVLPRGAGTRLGAAPDRRAYNVVLKQVFRSDIVTLASRLSTDGGWSNHSGDFVHSRIAGQDRFNLSMRFRDEGRLLEAARDIVQPSPRYPYSIGGNLIADPRSSTAEIDPGLSDLVGRVVTIAGIPAGIARPTLTDFAMTAFKANITDLGRYRTLRPDLRSYGLGLTSASRLAPWLTSSVNAQLDLMTTGALLGLPATVVIVPQGNTFSPFANSVGIARLGSTALRQRYRSLSGSVAILLDASFGQWQASMDGRYQHGYRRTNTDRPAGALLKDLSTACSTVSPFDGSCDVESLSSRVISKLHDAQMQLSATGPLVQLPAGPLRLSVSAVWKRLALLSRYNEGAVLHRSVRRSEQTAQGNVEIPITSRRNKVISSLGDVSANLDYGLTDVAGLGTVQRHGFGVTWTPDKWLRLQAMLNSQRQLAEVGQLGDPMIVTPGIRYLDFVTGKTVDVTQVTGGNPALRAARLTRRRISLNAAPWRSINLQINAEFSKTRNRNLIAYLPPASAQLLAAFPDRFVRDAGGTLVLVDTRAVNLAGRMAEQLRWGVSFLVPLNSADAEKVTEPGATGPSLRARARGSGPRPRVQLTLFHTINLNDKVQIRAGVEPINLLRGGAVGFGGGIPRHIVDAGLNLSDRGVGVRLHGSWRSATRIGIGATPSTDRVNFSSLATFSAHAFADLSQLWQHRPWLAGTRLSINMINLGNTRQGVFDQTGNIPLRYQPGYRDPLGCTIEFQLRKTF